MIVDLIKSEGFRITVETIFKIILCIILVGSIGYNREKKGMVVGIRTHVLVGIAGLLIQLTSIEYIRIHGGSNDIFRLAGQYVSGIGFLGAGTILKDNRSVKGLTTAASIYLVACIGLAVGSGIYISSIIVTVIAYVFLTDLFRLKNIINTNKNSYVQISLDVIGNLEVSIQAMKDIIRSFGVNIVSIEVDKKFAEKNIIKFKLDIDDEIDINDILAELISLGDVNKAKLI